jgi:hypothetical protein
MTRNSVQSLKSPLIIINDSFRASPDPHMSGLPVTRQSGITSGCASGWPYCGRIAGYTSTTIQELCSSLRGVSLVNYEVAPTGHAVAVLPEALNQRDPLG